MPVPGSGEPDPARVYDYLVKGDEQPGYSLPADRRLARALTAADPGLPERLRTRLRFTAAAVRQLAASGVTAILDIGGGYPGRPAGCEEARKAAPAVTCACVGDDVGVLGAARAAFAGDAGVAVVGADPRDPAAALGDPAMARVLAPGQPAAVVLRRLHQLDPAEAAELAAAWMKPMAPGSALILACPCYRDPDALKRAQDTSLVPFRSYSPAEFAALFAGLDLAWPGISSASAWLRGVPWIPGYGTFDLAAAGVKP